MIYIILLCALITAAFAACPSAQIPPCGCLIIAKAPFVSCFDADNVEDLKKSMGLLKNSEAKVVAIVDSTLSYVPHDLLEGFRIDHLLLQRTSLGSLSDSDVAFQGVERTLKSLRILDTRLLVDLDWSQLRNLKELRKLAFEKGRLEFVDEGINYLPYSKLTELNLVDAQISYLSDSAFSKFTNLAILSLAVNMIEDVKRSMFPRSPNKLEEINLNSNKISALPEDFFTNMPKLVSVSLADNAFTTIHEQVFLPIWSQLNKIDVLGNPMRCDCRLKWIVGKGMPKNFWGNCEEPQEVKGKEIKDLGTNDLWC